MADSRPPYTRSAFSVPAGPSQQRGEADSGPFTGTSVNTPSEAHNGAEENDDTLIEVIMAVDMTPRGTVGCCYYVARDEKLYFMEDIQCGDVNVVDSCMFFLQNSK
jgi:DNA mismatch repair protein MSH5